MSQAPSINAIWESIEPKKRCFSFEDIADLPALAQLYLAHSIAPGTRLATAIRLKMHGELKLNAWLPFTAEQIISEQHGFVWKATVKAGLFPIHGYDQLLHGEGTMDWKLLGLIPITRASGTDTTRSTIGRLHGESIWLPSLLLQPTTLWHELPQNQLAATLSSFGECTTLKLQLGHHGQLSALQFLRWGEQSKDSCRYRNFGGTFSEEKTFQGYTIPTTMKIGWDYCMDDPDTWEGEFFRATITDAEFR